MKKIKCLKIKKHKISCAYIYVLSTKEIKFQCPYPRNKVFYHHNPFYHFLNFLQKL